MDRSFARRIWHSCAMKRKIGFPEPIRVRVHGTNDFHGTKHFRTCSSETIFNHGKPTRYRLPVPAVAAWVVTDWASAPSTARTNRKEQHKYSALRRPQLHNH